MSISLIQSKLNIIQSRGIGCLEPDIVFIDEWIAIPPSSYDINDLGLVNQSSELFFRFLSKSEIDLSKVYYTWAEKGWMYSEDEWHESLKKELEVLRPKVVVSLGDRKVVKILLKVKDMIRDFVWFHKIHHPCVIDRFYEDHDFYIEELNFLARDYQNGEIVTINQSFK